MVKLVRWLSPAFLVLLIGASAPTCDAPDDAHLTSVKYVAQTNGVWCWAAVGEMSMNAVHASEDVKQCKEVEWQTGATCCPTSSASKCSVTGWPDYNHFHFDATPTNEGVSLSWKQLKCQLGKRGTPVPFSWRDWGNSHLMIAIGYSNKGGKRMVEIYDPKNYVNDKFGVPHGDFVKITYEEYDTGVGKYHHHRKDYYDLKYRGP